MTARTRWAGASDIDASALKVRIVDFKLRLISHHLCPYVQRAVIVATEKNIPFERIDIDLGNKPDWFLTISPTEKTPLLEIDKKNGTREILFESAVIAEFIDEISDEPLLPRDPLKRARERAWVEFASATLSSISKFYLAPHFAAFEQAKGELIRRLAHVEKEISGPWFAGDRFGLVDAAFGPAFRYLEVFKAHAGMDLLNIARGVTQWAEHLADRPSVISAVAEDYPQRLIEYIKNKQSHLGHVLGGPGLAA